MKTCATFLMGFSFLDQINYPDSGSSLTHFSAPCIYSLTLLSKPTTFTTVYIPAQHKRLLASNLALSLFYTHNSYHYYYHFQVPIHSIPNILFSPLIPLLTAITTSEAIAWSSASISQSVSQASHACFANLVILLFYKNTIFIHLLSFSHYH